MKNILNIYKRISVQYHKTVTCNISVCTSSECRIEEDKDVLHVPVEIGKKLSRTSLGNATWPTDVDQQYTTAIACNISETQYLCQKIILITY